MNTTQEQVSAGVLEGRELWASYSVSLASLSSWVGPELVSTRQGPQPLGHYAGPAILLFMLAPETNTLSHYLLLPGEEEEGR